MPCAIVRQIGKQVVAGAEELTGAPEMMSRLLTAN